MVPHSPFRALVLLCCSGLVYLMVVMSHLDGYQLVRVTREEAPTQDIIGLLRQRQDLLNLDVAIIACYRDRVVQRNIFINYMNTFLLSQNSSARIYIVEQAGNDPFNRAKLFNVGYMEAKKDYNYSCFIFHDIDLLPDISKLKYGCGPQPIHMSAYIDKYNYTMRYRGLFGGVSALTERQLQTVNGYSNQYWGWGGEDDDMSKRVQNMSYTIHRPPRDLGRYTMLRSTGQHTTSAPNRARFGLMRKTLVNMAKDGLSNLDYELVKKADYKTHIWILADLKHKRKRQSQQRKNNNKKTNKKTSKPNASRIKRRTTVYDSNVDTPECRQKQLKRTITLNKVCDSHRLSNSNITTWSKRRYNLVVLEKEKALFCFMPLSAAAVWKTKLLTHRGVIREEDYRGIDVVAPDKTMQQTLRKYDIRPLSSYNQDEAEIILNTYYKFAFFMNPYTKLYLAFRDQLNNSHNAHYHAEANHMLQKLKLKPPFTFEKFMTFLVEATSPGRYDIHWQRSLDLCNPCHINYDFVGEVETLAADAACVLPHLGMSPWFPTPRGSNMSAKQEEAEHLYSELPEHILSKLESVFGVDAALFGYTIPGWL